MSRGIIVTCAIVAVVSVILAVFLGKDHERGVSLRFNAGVLEAREFADAPAETREAELKKLVGDYLAIGDSSNDPIIQSAAYLQAGVLALWDYDEALKKSAEPVYLLEQPSRARLDSAHQYLGEAARICGGEKDRDACFFKEIQTNLDHARFLQETKDRVDAGQNSSNPRDGERITKKEAKNLRAPTNGGSLPSERLEGEAENALERPVAGSIRGGHSVDPADVHQGIDPGEGSGYQISPNKP